LHSLDYKRRATKWRCRTGARRTAPKAPSDEASRRVGSNHPVSIFCPWSEVAPGLADLAQISLLAGKVGYGVNEPAHDRHGRYSL
jgi:hypothetical protein